MGDPTGTFDVTNDGMCQIGEPIARFDKPTLFVQEGGYSIKNLRTGINAFFRGVVAAGLY